MSGSSQYFLFSTECVLTTPFIFTVCASQQCINNEAEILRLAITRFPMCSNYVTNKVRLIRLCIVYFNNHFIQLIYAPAFGFPDFAVDGMNAV